MKAEFVAGAPAERLRRGVRLAGKFGRVQNGLDPRARLFIAGSEMVDEGQRDIFGDRQPREHVSAALENEADWGALLEQVRFGQLLQLLAKMDSMTPAAGRCNPGDGG